MAPLRTCVGCRAKRPQDELLRFVSSEQGKGRGLALAPDVCHRNPGRGVYTCPSVECVTRAVNKGGFARSLRQRVRVDAKTLLRAVVTALEQASVALLQQMLGDGRARLAEPGSERARVTEPADDRQLDDRQLVDRQLVDRQLVGGGRAVWSSESQEGERISKLDQWARELGAQRESTSTAE